MRQSSSKEQTVKNQQKNNISQSKNSKIKQSQSQTDKVRFQKQQNHISFGQSNKNTQQLNSKQSQLIWKAKYIDNNFTIELVKRITNQFQLSNDKSNQIQNKDKKNKNIQLRKINESPISEMLPSRNLINRSQQGCKTQISQQKIIQKINKSQQQLIKHQQTYQQWKKNKLSSIDNLNNKSEQNNIQNFIETNQEKKNNVSKLDLKDKQKQRKQQQQKQISSKANQFKAQTPRLGSDIIKQTKSNNESIKEIINFRQTFRKSNSRKNNEKPTLSQREKQQASNKIQDQYNRQSGVRQSFKRSKLNTQGSKLDKKGKSLISLSINASNTNSKLEISRMNKKINQLEQKLNKVQMQHQSAQKNQSSQQLINNKKNKQLSKIVQKLPPMSNNPSLHLQSATVNVKTMSLNKQSKTIRNQMTDKLDMMSLYSLQQSQRLVVQKNIYDNSRWKINDKLFNSQGQVINQSNDNLRKQFVCQVENNKIGKLKRLQRIEQQPKQTKKKQSKIKQSNVRYTNIIQKHFKNQNASKLPKLCQEISSGKRTFQHSLPNPKFINRNISSKKKQKEDNKIKTMGQLMNNQTNPTKFINLKDKSAMTTNMFSKRQKSLILKGIQPYKIIQEHQNQNQRSQEIDFQKVIKGKYFNPEQNERKKVDKSDNRSQKSTKTGKKIFQIQFKAKKYQIPDDQSQPENQNYKIIKQCTIQPIILDIKLNPPTPQMTAQQLMKKGESLFAILGQQYLKSKDYSGLKVIKFRNCIQFSIDKCPDQLIWHYSGKFYYGGWVENQDGEGEKSGIGLQYAPEKHIYQGQFLKNKRNGTGKIQLANGNLYQGQWFDGNKHGYGKFIEKSTKAFYEGQWIDNKREGYGFLRISQKQFYVGTFIRSVKHGHGLQHFMNGDKYKGEYQQGKFHGKGRYTWANGSFYEGRFQEGYRQGFGFWRSSRKGGSMYIGEYLNDKKHGYGRFVYEAGGIFQGQYINDMKNGPGRMIDIYGIEKKGVWKDDQLVEVDTHYQIRNDEDYYVDSKGERNIYPGKGKLIKK